MEKPTKSKSKIFSFLPKGATVSFENHPFSPGRHKRSENLHKLKACNGKGFSGPMISMIPAEARLKSKSGRSFGAQEPTSPKISCMGTIKHKKKSKSMVPKPLTPQPPRKEKKPNAIRNIFGGGAKQGRKSDASANKTRSTTPDHRAPPSLSGMKQFASSRDALADFDWKYCCEREESDEEDDYKVPHSAPMMIGGGGVAGKVVLEPRKEINLWKRRTMDPPQPLQVNGMGTT